MGGWCAIPSRILPTPLYLILAPSAIHDHNNGA
jgi:hypothetical protein